LGERKGRKNGEEESEVGDGKGVVEGR